MAESYPCDFVGPLPEGAETYHVEGCSCESAPWYAQLAADAVSAFVVVGMIVVIGALII